MLTQRPRRFNTQKVIRLQRENQQLRTPAFVVDLSNNGVLIETTTALTFGDIIDINLNYHRHGKQVTIDGRCEVVRVDRQHQNARFGLKFINKFVNTLSKPAFTPLNQMVKQQQQQQQQKVVI
ncbi:MAG: PilZ domain-containing protein [Methylococcales bacterium]|jgi:hypothetical protein|nr:PilZ domain-containing protein [Methylococcales bacterium]MBT7445830.1 PilZ domain-containing protein [Methylococcales bacterium]